MNEHVQALIHALRGELEQYGALLALLEQQRDLVIHRAPDALLANLAALNAQTAVVEVARRDRETRQRQLAAALHLPATTTLTELGRCLPGDVGLLLQALLDEINACLRRAQTAARQNHLLLSRSVDLLQRFIAALFPAPAAPTYQANGQLAAPATPGRGLCEVTA